MERTTSWSRLTALAAILILLAARLRAQTITGTVVGDGQPLAGATVRLLELDRATRTGAAGDFRFTDVPRGTYRVFVALVGFGSAVDTVRLASDVATASFALRRSVVPLKAVVVSASPVARTSDEQYQSVETKSRTEFENSSGISFADKLSDLPGVTVRGNGAAPSRPILRGLGDNEVVILENGLRMGDIATYDPAHATPIDAMSIAQVDVVRGPASILYGPNTIGGLVNVITNLVPQPSGRPSSGTVALEANSVNTSYSGYVNHVVTSGNSAFRVSAGALHAGDIAIPAGSFTDPETGTPFDLHRIPQTFDHSGEGGAGYAYQSTFGMVGIGANHYEMNYGIPGVPPNADFLDVPPTTSRIAQQRNTVELRSLFNAGSAWFERVKLDASYNDYNHSEFPTVQDSNGVSDPEANHFHKRELNTVLQFVQRQQGRLSGTIGLWSDVQNLQIAGDQPLGPNSITTDLAGYLYEEYRAAEHTRLQAGIRYDYDRIQTRPFAGSSDSVFRTLDESRQHNAVTASFGVLQQLTPELTGSFSIARSFRTPTVQELFANGIDAASSTYSVGTASLGPESGVGVDASIKGTYSRAQFEFSPYVNFIDNYIFGFLRGDTIEDFPVRQFSATRARLAGFEAAVTVQATPEWSIRGSSDYVNAQDTKQNEPLPFIPPLRGLVRSTYQGARYSGMVEWRGAASQTRLGAGDTPTAGYGMVNLGVGLRLVNGGIASEIGLHLDNALNTLYRDNLSVIKDFVPQPGRGIRLNYVLMY